MKPPTKRCAIYTRKSSDEGLDQEFNSLDAQRVAGEAYIQSQSGEGWKLKPARYDDGGYSGGTMERPALKALLTDIEAGHIDVIIVYKIDRLTRSLADFARMVELFDRHNVSFVSVTQSFNTTSSMGRLTLNVLLSFAQFEREVTGERIRDKIAASKARGMWMGGTLPLGYDLPTGTERALVVNEAEARIVDRIFRLYLELGSVHAVERVLNAEGIRTKLNIARNGNRRGGVAFSRGSLFHLLRNKTYLGHIVHKDKVHAGLHEAIIEEDLFNAVQARLDCNARRTAASGSRVAKALLSGRLYDSDGNPMSPSFSRGRTDKLYRYYVSAPLQQGSRLDASAIRRVSAPQIEALVGECLAKLLPHQPDPLMRLQRAEIHNDTIHLLLPASLRVGIMPDQDITLLKEEDASLLRLIAPVKIAARKGQVSITLGTPTPRANAALVKALRKAHAMVTSDACGMPIVHAAPTSPYLRKIIRLAFLAPDIQRAILAGLQPQSLSLEQFIRDDIPLCWAEQRRKFGFGSPT